MKLYTWHRQPRTCFLEFYHFDFMRCKLEGIFSLPFSTWTFGLYRFPGANACSQPHILRVSAASEQAFALATQVHQSTGNWHTVPRTYASLPCSTKLRMPAKFFFQIEHCRLCIWISMVYIVRYIFHINGN